LRRVRSPRVSGSSRRGYVVTRDIEPLIRRDRDVSRV
jgi:hypothetical protein